MKYFNRLISLGFFLALAGSSAMADTSIQTYQIFETSPPPAHFVTRSYYATHTPTLAQPCHPYKGNWKGAPASVCMGF